MQEQRGFVEQPVGRLHVFQHDALGERAQLLFFLGVQFLAGEDHDRHVAQRRFGLHFFQQRIAAHVGQPQIQHAAVERLVQQLLERFPARAGGFHFDVVVAQQFHHAVALDFVVFHDEQPFGARTGELLDAVEALFQTFGRGRFDDVGKRAVGKSVLAFFLDGNDLHRNVPRGRDPA